MPPEAPHNGDEREEIVEIHPPIPPEDEELEGGRVRWERLDPQELIYPYPPANLMDLIIAEEGQRREEAIGLINQYLHLRDPVHMEDHQLPLIIEDGRIIANPDFDVVDAFRIVNDDRH